MKITKYLSCHHLEKIGKNKGRANPSTSLESRQSRPNWNLQTNHPLKTHHLIVATSLLALLAFGGVKLGNWEPPLPLKVRVFLLKATPEKPKARTPKKWRFPIVFPALLIVFWIGFLGVQIPSKTRALERRGLEDDASFSNWVMESLPRVSLDFLGCPSFSLDFLGFSYIDFP